MNQVWMYWEGPLPPHIALCMASVRRHAAGLEVHVVEPATVSRYLPAVRDVAASLSKPAHRADYLRTRLVHRHGGLWVDSDMVALSALQPLLDIPMGLDYACQNIATSIGCFAARPGAALLQRMIEVQDKVLDGGGQPMRWNGIGNDLLRQLGASYPHHRWPEWWLDEIAGSATSKLLSLNERLQDNVASNAVLFHLSNEVTGHYLQQRIRASRLLRSRMLVSQIFRRGLGMEEPVFHRPLVIDKLLDRRPSSILGADRLARAAGRWISRRTPPSAP